MDVSVIIPFYKGNKYINNILKMLEENVHNAKKISIEAIIVNDSPEVEVQYNENLVDGYELDIIKHERNFGIQQARITGINAARGKFILMLDQDDEIMANTIKSQVDLIGDNAAVISNGYSENIGGEKTKLYKNKRQMSGVNNFSYYFYFGNMIASPGLCLVRKESIPKFWLTNIIKKNGADDWLLWVLFLNEGNRFMLNDEKLYVHKNDGHNTSNDEVKMIVSSEEALNIAKFYGMINSKFLSIYERRLKMRRKCMNGKKINKIVQYLKNPDIFWHVLKYKKLM